MSDETTIDAPGEDTSEQDERPLIDPETGWNRLMVEQMARDIQIAHKVNGSSWSLMALDDNSNDVILSVGGIGMATTIDGSGGRLLINADFLASEQRATFKSVMKRRELTTVGMQSAADVSISIETTQTVLASLSGNHEQLVREQAGRASRGAQPNGWHRGRLVEEIERIIGEDLPKPDFVAELSWLAETFDLELLRHLAEDIDVAHAAQPSSWALYSRQTGAITLGVRSISALWLTVDGCGVYLNGQREDDQYRDGLPESAVSKTFKDIPGFTVGELTLEQTDTCLPLFASQHRDAIRKLASGVTTRTRLGRNHNPLLVEELGRIVGRQLPQPLRVKQDEEIANEISVSVDPNATIGFLSVIKRYFRSSGLQYTDAQIATFYTALQTKGFVVLSGISGTGKSKIAQGFVDMMPVPAAALEEGVESEVLRLKRMPTFLTTRLVTLPAKQIDMFTFPEEQASWPVHARMGGKESDATLIVQWLGGQRMVQLRIKGELVDLIAAIPKSGRFYGSPEIDEETGRIVEIEFFRQLPAGNAGLSVKPGSNHLFLSVRPDWRDSTSLLGYFNPLTQTYEWTDFLRFILRAVDSYRAKDGLAWFVILDEMNLAHVEYYFADLLSVIESGRRTNPEDELAGFTREPLRTTYPDTLDDEVPTREIQLPPNLYIIGTVNMDETTHAFSPKVLDRAFTIELTDVSFVDYPPLVAPNAAADLPETEKQKLLRAVFMMVGRLDRGGESHSGRNTLGYRQG